MKTISNKQLTVNNKSLRRAARSEQLRCELERGGALLIALLVVAIISTIAFSLGRLMIGEIQMTSSLEDSTSAYYAAEAGLEDGLSQWRQNHNLEIITAERVNLSTETGKPIPYYDLKVNYKGSAVGENMGKAGADIKKSLKLYKDQSREYLLPASGTVTFYWQGPYLTNNLGVDVLTGFANIEWYVYDSISGEIIGNKHLENANNPSNKISFNIPSGTNRKVKIIPYIGTAKNTIYPNLVYGTANTNEFIYYAITSTAGNIDTGQTTIEATGYFGRTKRKLQAKIDRASGQVLGLYDFVIFSGKDIK